MGGVPGAKALGAGMKEEGQEGRGGVVVSVHFVLYCCSFAKIRETICVTVRDESDLISLNIPISLATLYDGSLPPAVDFSS